MYLQLSGELHIFKGTLRPCEVGKGSDLGVGLARSSKGPALGSDHSLGCEGQGQTWQGEPGWDAAWMARQEHWDEQAACGLGTGPRSMDRPGFIPLTRVRSGSPWHDPTGEDVVAWQNYPVLKGPYIAQFPNISIHSNNCETLKDDCNVIICHLSN